MAVVNPEVQYLKSLQAVRERSKVVFEAAKEGSLNNFVYNADRMLTVVELVASVITRDFGPDKFGDIPPHGRWQHFNVGGVDRITPLIQEWEAAGKDNLEIARRLIDLFFVSVLLDAGAGDVWTFKEAGTNASYGRSEGIAVASLYMFKEGAFSSDKQTSVDARALTSLNEEIFKHGFQISAENPIVSLDSRVTLMNRLGTSLIQLPQIFGDSGRPGGLVDYLMGKAAGSGVLDYEVLWDALQQVLLPAWPNNRPTVDGIPIGDAWPLKVQAQRSGSDKFTDSIQPFHKLTQWLGYSLTVPFVRLLGFKWTNDNLGTGLPEYRNGGLFMDTGVLQLKDDILKQGLAASGGQSLPMFSTTSDTIIEWRAMTVALLDELHKLVNEHFVAKHGIRLSLAQMLEAGSWKCGRELAAKYRPETRSSPILLEGDGTLF